jgi:hypothetical protein
MAWEGAQEAAREILALVTDEICAMAQDTRVLLEYLAYRRAEFAAVNRERSRRGVDSKDWDLQGVLPRPVPAGQVAKQGVRAGEQVVANAGR